MRRAILLVLIVLAALAASGASAKNPTPPEGTWDLRTTDASYSGPSTRMHAALVNLIQRRVVFSPACTQTVCASYATVRTATGGRVKFVLTSKTGGPFAGRVVIGTGLRCGGRALRATLEMNVTVLQRQQGEPTDRLVGATSRRAVNPGGCSLFRNYTRVVRRTQFVGVSVSG